ncbi:family 78 glycoside hydrolase catalytic domain [Arenibacter sp. M-2]|uniref:alpha-L-rhamnosidase-related protein n=1 Tax=Arenibacter sp. M-2 TaxID=3053612 RepID=UPI0025711133|nr:alpha-L-rhamnosidase C-terminal domain-containing protein [Arenibacter sp. M-2]MDL5510363.1 family 78 glycoside hydrolase catalytic domain [Arenibacter sp. M-2]|tara:strand:- start:6894 stop:9086 length:2193 start_codon:yes stop_codon:yes gene_type:complete
MHYKIYIILLISLISSGFLGSYNLVAQEKKHEATWIWYPGDYEIWLSNKMQARRTEREAVLPPLWQYYSPYPLVTFQKELELPEADEVSVYTEGSFMLLIDDVLVQGQPQRFTLAAGKHKIVFRVFNQETVPAIFVNGTNLKSDNTWMATHEDKLWIDENGMPHQSGTPWIPVGIWNFNAPPNKPSEFKLPTEPWYAKKSESVGTGHLVDFGKETFGYIRFHGLQGKGKVALYYGESKEEAIDSLKCETLDYLKLDGRQTSEYTVEGSKAFRYVQVQSDATVRYDSISMLYEYLPVDYRGEFKSSDTLLNKIWEVSAYTLHLNTREFFLDGIKRDRWVWSGDAHQSYLMNYYLFFDSPTVRRTLLALRGKEPVTAHINTIMDYSLYWFVGIYDYYLYTGDEDFIKNFYPRMQSLMDFCLERRNENGMLSPLPGDWVFIDWADGLGKTGEVSFEQLLFARSLEAIALCAGIAGDQAGEKEYTALAEELRTKLFDVFWSDEKKALMHQRVAGKVLDNVTRYANMFGIFFDYFTEAQKKGVKEEVLLNDDIQQITTPYMRFYELEALCAMGEHKLVLDEVRSYWGDMLKLGATSFWEKYDPSEQGSEHLAMYGRPYGKSLCHAWGASPIYLFGKYYLGVKPTAPGYNKYVIEPHLGGLKWIEGKVPTPKGEISVSCTEREIRVSSVEGRGNLIFRSRVTPSTNRGKIKYLDKYKYQIDIDPGYDYQIKYKAFK